MAGGQVSHRVSYFGLTTEGTGLEEQAANRLRLGFYSAVHTDDGRFNAINAFIDGGGSGGGDQLVAPVVYRANGNLLASGNYVTVPAGLGSGWVTFEFNQAYEPLAPQDAADWYIGLHFQGVANSVRLGAVAATTGGRAATTATVPTSLPGLSTTTTPALFAGVSGLGAPPSVGVSDIEYARMGFGSAQAMLSGAPLSSSASTALCEWHGTRVDPERGYFAVVRSGGPLASLVGERLLVSNDITGASVRVYCHREVDIEADISLTRRGFSELGELSLTELDVVVELIA